MGILAITFLPHLNTLLYNLYIQMAHFSDEGLCPVGFRNISNARKAYFLVYPYFFFQLLPTNETFFWSRLCGFMRAQCRKFNLKTNHRGCRNTWMSRQPNMPGTKDFKRHPDILGKKLWRVRDYKERREFKFHWI